MQANENDFLHKGAYAMPVHAFALDENRDVLSVGVKAMHALAKSENGFRYEGAYAMPMHAFAFDENPSETYPSLS